MKKIILLICLFQCLDTNINAQSYLLLDRHWDKSAILTDSVTRQNLSDGWYPMYKDELDTLIILVNRLKNLRDDGLSRKFYYSEDFKAPHLKLVI